MSNYCMVQIPKLFFCILMHLHSVILIDLLIIPLMKLIDKGNLSDYPGNKIRSLIRSNLPPKMYMVLYNNSSVVHLQKKNKKTGRVT